MHRLTVLYPHPDSPRDFLDYYETHHMPLVAALPGILGYRYGAVEPLGTAAPAHFLVFEADFPSREVLMAALGSSEGKAVAADVPRYSPKGFAMLHYEVVEPGTRSRP